MAENSGENQGKMMLVAQDRVSLSLFDRQLILFFSWFAEYRKAPAGTSVTGYGSKDPSKASCGEPVVIGLSLMKTKD